MTESDEPRQADAIVVLGGDATGLRVERAVELFNGRWAPVLVISGGSVYREITHADLMRKHAIELGVPADKVITQGNSGTTAEDAEFTTKILRDRGVGRAILVTSPWHSARAVELFRSASPDISWVSCPSRQEWSGDWWSSNDATRSIVTEILKTCVE